MSQDASGGDSLRHRLIARFDEMSPQLQQAARHLIEHPHDIALISMRELARQAGVQPATMTRLAKFMGASGYEELRGEEADAIRQNKSGFAARARESRSRNSEASPAALAGEMLHGLSNQLLHLSSPESLTRIETAATRLAQARRVYVLGLRSCHSIGWQFHYVLSLLGDKTRHLDGPGGTIADGLFHAGAEDVLLVASVSPYAKQSLEIAGHARALGLGVVAITDSEVSPLAALADVAVICPVESLSFFHSLTPAFAVAEILCGLIAQAQRDESLAALAETDARLDAFDIYAAAIPPRNLR